MTSGKTSTAATMESIHKALAEIDLPLTTSFPDFSKAMDINL